MVVVLKDGAYSGKGAARQKVMDACPTYGVAPFIVPNAKHIREDGVDATSPAQIRMLHCCALETMRSLEDASKDLARKSGKPAVVICDVGAFDLRVSMDKVDFGAIVLVNGFSGIAEVKKSYDLVIHMVTAEEDDGQDGTKYGTGHRADDREVAENSMQKDMQIRTAWSDHPQ